MRSDNVENPATMVIRLKCKVFKISQVRKGFARDGRKNPDNHLSAMDSELKAEYPLE